MITEIRLYYEGDKRLTPGFSEFFSELRKAARNNRCGFRLIATGATPCEDFGNAIASHPGAWNILLLDSDCPDDGRLTSALISRYGWSESLEGSIFWMVEMMESWFHADKKALGRYYGKRFKEGALAPNPNVEQIPKRDLKNGLKAATRDTQKGPYHKTHHAPALLESIDPLLVCAAAINCRRLFEAVRTGL